MRHEGILPITPTPPERLHPACPEQSEHEKTYRLLDAPAIGLTLTRGCAIEPERWTLAIFAHHPQAVYFGMKSGFLPKDKGPDDIIAGSDCDATHKRDHDARDAHPRTSPRSPPTLAPELLRVPYSARAARAVLTFMTRRLDPSIGWKSWRR